MIPGIDPKIDIAFKKVFGSESSRTILVHLIDAVLTLPPWERLVDVQLLNPYSEKMTLDDKLSILDIKARDERGRLFNLEMQMVASRALPERFVYYSSKTYTHQLTEGDDYSQLCPTIAICFVNGVLFGDWSDYHTPFQLRNPDGRLCLTNDLAIHLIELPKFGKRLEELETPLDLWLYFLQNGEGLDADALPSPLDAPEIRRAMGVLKMLAQNDLERELYEGRLKAKRDLQTLETLRDQWQQRYLEAEHRLDVVSHERDQASRERDQARQMVVRQIQLCQRLLRRSVSDAEDLAVRSLDELRDLADRLERDLTG
jgi:predicted transposase/invertase (TIGR01784 family)